MLRGVHTLLPLVLLLALRATAQDTPPAAPPTSPSSSAAPQGDTQTPPSSYEITGTARSGKTPLPGATVTVSNTLTGKKYSVVTDAEGKFTFVGIVRGRYVLRIEFMGFSLFTQEVVLNPT
ncbi:MAG TPA: carboxypeptidase-like regulatory domain-containing protein, partial [Verrucomicrobiae bacterium]|nr:carboxypeptidase-like regulatory domain-containing protein [Verrucomicrobiae bacterium]